MLIIVDSPLLHYVHSLSILQKIVRFDDVFNDRQHFIAFEIRIHCLCCFKSDGLSELESFTFSLFIS